EKFVDLTLPALTIGLYLAPLLIRTLRGSMIDVLSTDYIEAARARGLSSFRVIGRHTLRNASMATVTVLAVNLGFLISGTVIVRSSSAFRDSGRSSCPRCKRATSRPYRRSR